MILSFINIRKVPREVLKTEGPWEFALGFQHFPWDLANVNEWKIILILLLKCPGHNKFSIIEA